jgi:hypothetical protein
MQVFESLISQAAGSRNVTALCSLNICNNNSLSFCNSAHCIQAAKLNIFGKVHQVHFISAKSPCLFLYSILYNMLLYSLLKTVGSRCRYLKERTTANERCFRVAENGPNEAWIYFGGSIQKDTFKLYLYKSNALNAQDSQ